jgi:membrane protease YdiL (CAAX protease family)
MTQVAGSLTQAVTIADAVPRRAMLFAVAAIGTLAISRLPEILLREGLGIAIPWLEALPVVLAAFLWLGSRVIPQLRALTGYFAVMTAVSTIVAAIPVLFASAAWIALAPAASGEIVVILSERLVLGALGLAFVAGLVVLGGRDGAKYLRLRNGRWRSTDIGRPRIRWVYAGPIAIGVLVLLTGLVMAPALPTDVDLGTAAPFLVMAVLAAALNAFWEEAVFRAAPLARLAPVVGAGRALVIVAVWFGLGHFYGGVPSGMFGAVMVSVVGVVLGKAMVDSRGFAWPWVIHTSIDLTIYTVIALAATGS